MLVQQDGQLGSRRAFILFLFFFVLDSRVLGSQAVHFFCQWPLRLSCPCTCRRPIQVPSSYYAARKTNLSTKTNNAYYTQKRHKAVCSHLSVVLTLHTCSGRMLFGPVIARYRRAFQTTSTKKKTKGNQMQWKPWWSPCAKTHRQRAAVDRRFINVRR